MGWFQSFRSQYYMKHLHETLKLKTLPFKGCSRCKNSKGGQQCRGKGGFSQRSRNDEKVKVNTNLYSFNSQRFLKVLSQKCCEASWCEHKVIFKINSVP